MSEFATAHVMRAWSCTVLLADSFAHVGLVGDWTRCDGHGLCARLPERIIPDDWAHPVLHNTAVNPDAPTTVRRAVAACPVLALRLK